MYGVTFDNDTLDLTFKCKGVECVHFKHDSTCAVEIEKAVIALVGAKQGVAGIRELLDCVLKGKCGSASGEVASSMRISLAEMEMYGIGYLAQDRCQLRGHGRVRAICVREEQERGADTVASDDSGARVDVLPKKDEECYGPNGGKSYGRGKNYARNLQARQRASRARAVRVDSQQLPSAFVGCSADEVREYNRVSRDATIADLKARKAKSDSYVRHMNLVTESRVHETKFELARQTAESKLRIISEKRLGGFVEGTVMSSAATPSVSSGSVSPSSSISMAEVKRKDGLIVSLEAELAKAKVSCKLHSKESEELKQLKASISREKNRKNVEEERIRKSREDEWREDVAWRNATSPSVQVY